VIRRAHFEHSSLQRLLSQLRLRSWELVLLQVAVLLAHVGLEST
jgi:hypothetical protein